MYILGYRDVNDRRYYVTTYIQSPRLSFAFGINFLIDTGAARTQLSWNDATEYGRIIIGRLPPDNFIYKGIGGTVKAYVLEGTTFTFRRDNGRHDINIGNLSVSDYETTDHRKCPRISSMLGIDILCMFDLLFDNTFVMLNIK